MVYYSALHYAAKAAKSAEAAADSATQASESSGKIIQVGFDGTLANGVLTFKHAPGGVETPYNLQDDFEYELDLAFASTATLPTNTQMVIKNGNDTIRFVSALHRDAATNATVADMDAVMRFNSSTGYRWLFKAAYKVTTSGDKVFLLYPVVAKEDTSKITNCITEIPQDIKLELNGGKLTLKAGSKVYVPNGVNRFDEVVVKSDVSQVAEQLSGTNKWLLCVNQNGNGIFPRVLANCVSGAGVTAKAGWAYDTTTNLINWYSASGEKQSGNFSLPVCIFSTTDGVPTSINKVFNGFGYIGSTVFALPGVKGLIPKGRNNDGSLKNEEFTVGKVRTYTNASTRNNAYLALSANDNDMVGRVNEFIVTDDISQSDTGRVVYSPTLNKNIISGGTEWKWAIVGQWSSTSSSPFNVTSFTPKLPFRAVDQNDFNKLDEEVTTLDAQNVKLTGNQTITGTKTFNDYIVLNTQGGNEGAQIEWRTGNQSVLQDTHVKQDVVGNLMRFFAKNSAGTVIHPLQLDFETGNAYGNTVPATANNTALATTAWVNSSFKNILIPNVGSKVDIVTAVSSTNGYTAPSSGFVSVQTSYNGTTTTLSVGGVVVAQAHQYSGDSHGSESKQLFALVGKGQVVKTDQPVQFGVFVPFK